MSRQIASNTSSKAFNRRTSWRVYMTHRIEQFNQQKRFGTAKSYQRTLTRFNDFLNGKRLSIIQFNEKTVLDFNDYLERRGVVRNTISFYMRILKATYNQAVKEGLTDRGNLFDNVYTGVDQTKKRCIEEHFMEAIMELEITGKPRLALARDLFLFSFCTRGMPFVDMAYLQKRDIKDGYISYVRRKTKQRLYIRIEPCVQDIIDRYWWRESPYLFPIIHSDDPTEAYKEYRSQIGYYNHLLKQLGKMVGTETPLTSYTTRHTWATSAQHHQTPISIISAAMGHSSEAVTRIYLASIDGSLVDNVNAELLRGLNAHYTSTR